VVTTWSEVLCCLAIESSLAECSLINGGWFALRFCLIKPFYQANSLTTKTTSFPIFPLLASHSFPRPRTSLAKSLGSFPQRKTSVEISSC